jgi:hypothetical protein
MSGYVWQKLLRRLKHVRCPNSNSGDSVMSFDPMANRKRRSRNSVIYEEWQLGQAVEKEAVHVVVTKEFVLASC